MARARPLILLVDDEPHALSAMRMALEDDFEIATASGAAAALKILEDDWVQVIISDQRMPGMTGVEFLAQARERWPDTVRIILTGYTDASAMSAAINDAGIHQFLTKPWLPDQLVMAAKNAARLFDLARENERLALEMRFLSTTVETRLEKRRKALRDGLGFETILRSPNSPMNAVVAQARQYASFDVPVLLTGEPGTAKAQLARAMHYGSLRSDRPFHEFSLSGVPEDLAALELFGAKRGTTPGNGTRIGLIQKADRGTLYLGGIDCASPALQLSLMRVLSQGLFSPLGGQETLTSSVRILAGSHRDLRALVAEGQFRADLYYALSAGEIAVPPLRARRGDVAILAQQILDGLASTHAKPIHDFDAAALEFLENYDWPGNLRELTNEVTRMLIFAQGKVLGADLISRPILQAPPGESGADRSAQAVLTADGTLKDRVELIEMRILRETLTRHRWNKSRAAAELGLSRVGLRAKLDRYGIADPSGRVLAEEEED